MSSIRWVSESFSLAILSNSWGKKGKKIQNVVFDEFKANFLSYTMKDTLEGKLSLINSQKKNY